MPERISQSLDSRGQNAIGMAENLLRKLDKKLPELISMAMKAKTEKDALDFHTQFENLASTLHNASIDLYNVIENYRYEIPHNIDIYAAAAIFSVKPEDVTAEMKRRAREIGFTIKHAADQHLTPEEKDTVEDNTPWPSIPFDPVTGVLRGLPLGPDV